MEVRCAHPCPEATGVTIQVSSPRTGAPWYVSKGRYTRIWAFRCLPIPSEPWLRGWLRVRWCGEPLSTATRQIYALTEGWPRHLTRRPRAAGPSRTVEVMASEGQVDQTNRFRRWSAEHPSVTLNEVFSWFSSFVRQMPGHTTQIRGTARNPLLQARRLHLSAWQMSHTSSLQLSQSALSTQTSNQPKFILPIISPGQRRP